MRIGTPSCTKYHWATLIAFYRAVHQAQLMKWQKASPLTSGPGAKQGFQIMPPFRKQFALNYFN